MRLVVPVTRSLLGFLPLKLNCTAKRIASFFASKKLNDILERQNSGAPRQNRTGTLLRELDFESSASTNSARGATLVRKEPI